ncbi:hypothetical protein FAI41_07780 [Acetobacteraceae bacterium]|nr:hypothetical protein FAI41_07780 [Acetobacteraceae bacterium]
MPFDKKLITNVLNQSNNFQKEFAPTSLSKRLEKFSKIEALKAVGGLFTRPEFHANTLRLEHLVHLIMIYCNGTAKVTHKNVKDWLEFLANTSPCISQEDPIEDVFVSNLESYHGNLMVFEGIWTNNNYFLSAIINALSQCTNDKITEARENLYSIFSLLRLGNEVAKRAKLYRNIANLKSSPNTTKLPLPPEEFKKWGDYLIFTQEDLNSLQIPFTSLSAFFISENQINKLKEEKSGNSSLLSHPLIKIEDDTFIISLLPAIGVAARRFALSSALRSGFIDSFQKYIDEYHFQIFLNTSHLLSLKPISQDILTENPYERIASFDEGSYAHIILSSVNLKNNEAGIMDVPSPPPALITNRIIEVSKNLSEQSNFRKGITIILHGGLGSGLYTSLNANTFDKNWHIIPLTSGDLELLAYDSDFFLLRLYRLLERQRDPKNPLMPTEPLNLYGFFKERNFDLYFDNEPSGMPVLFSPCQDQGVFRVKMRQLLNKHLLRDPSLPQWLPVQRKNLFPYFSDMKEGKFYVSLLDISQQRLRGCYENNEYKWWVEINNTLNDFQPSSQIQLSWLLFEAFEFWIGRIAEAIKSEFHLPKWIFFNITYSNTEKKEIILNPKSPQQINIEFSKQFFEKCQQPKNEGERLLVETLIKGLLIPSNSKINEDLIGNLVNPIIPEGHARHIHMFQAQSLSDFIFNSAPLKKPRLCTAEITSLIDNGFAFNLGIPNISEGQPSNETALKLLYKGMDVLWETIQKRLNELDRKSVIIKALKNHDAILKERTQWERTASSLQACHTSEKDEVLNISANQEALRATSAVSSRVIVEMAICESRTQNGRICGDDDLDFLLTYIAKFIDLSAHYSEIKSGILGTNLFVLPSGKMNFKTDFLENVKTPYIQQLYSRNFDSHVEEYPSLYTDKNLNKEKQKVQSTREEHANFFKAMEIEYSVSFETLGALAGLLSEEVIKQKKTILEISEKELLKICVSLGMTETQSHQTLKRLSLEPREQWKKPPSEHKEGDILPWRNQRKYSLISRPFIRLEDANHPIYLISIPGFEQSLKYLCQAIAGTLAADLFYSDDMKKWIGSKIGELGLAFNAEVSERLKELDFHTQVEVPMTNLGGKKKNGDIDVLASKKETNTVYLIECKRLITSKNTEEIVRRLTEYAPDQNPQGKRSPTQKHLDRIAVIKNNLDQISQTTGIPKHKLQIKSCLVTSGVTPIPFQKTIKDCFDFILNFDSLEKLM